MSYNPANPILVAGGINGNTNAYANYAPQYMNPTTRLTIEQQNYLNQQQQQQQYGHQDDPYTNGTMLLAQCSDLIRNRIIKDPRYQKIDLDCEMLIKQCIYASIIPQVLNSQQGRISFERWENCIKQLKDEYSQEELATTQNMQIIMNDPIVMKRLQELQQQTQNQLNNDEIHQSNTDELTNLQQSNSNKVGIE